MLRHLVTLVGVAAFLSLAAGKASAVDYRPYLITNLGTCVGGTSGWSSPAAMNESGMVVGQATDARDIWHAFSWSGGTMTDLNGSDDKSTAYAVNDNGVVAGQTTHLGPGDIPTSFDLWIWQNDTRTTLSAGTANHITPLAINYDGVIVGQMSYNGNNPQAFYHNGGTNDTPVDIGTGFSFNYGFSTASDINIHGVLVGYGSTLTNDSNYYPFRYDLETQTFLSLRDIIPDARTTTAINDNGWILGKSVGTAIFGDAFLYNETTTTLIPDFSGTGTFSDARALNNNGQVVGSSLEGGGFLFDSDTGQSVPLYGMLGASGQAEWTSLTAGDDINDAGQIAGSGTTSDGDKRAFLMTPTLFGDANIDGSVNGSDLNTVLSNYNQTISGDSMSRWLAGDFNVDGSVNGTDLNTVLSNYNQSISFSSTAAVPEPGTMLLVITALLSLWGWRKRLMI